MTHVVFIHLDLGIGGAESLVLNLAKATLPNESQPFPAPSIANDASPVPSGTVSIYTTHCSANHCYDEVKPPNGPLYPFVHIRGNWIPRKLWLGGTALCSSLRILYLTYCAMKEKPNANVFVLDILPTGVPYLVEMNNVKAGVLFYCHFPDKLLTRDTVNGEADGGVGNEAGGSALSFITRIKRMYRYCLDMTEEWTMSFSDLIVVNSKFTMGEVQKVFPSLFLPLKTEGTGRQAERVKVLYPAIESSLSKASSKNSENSNSNIGAACAESITLGPIVSLNRFERKKNVSLLLHAYGLLLERAELGDLQIEPPPLIIAGGYDPLNIENVEHLAELRVLADQILKRYDLPPSVVISSSKSDSAESPCPVLNKATISFYPSVSNEKRHKLLSCASVWCYTPHREHFGIVPLEAMDAGVPVVAIRSGGPTETIVDGCTGYLVDYVPIESDVHGNFTVKGFADAIASILLDPEKSRVMGQRGRERVLQLFSMETFRKQWWKLLDEARMRGEQRHFRQVVSYPRLAYSVLRCLFEFILVFLFAVLITWIMKTMGWIEDDRGILGTVKFHYLKWFGRDEL
ncbi:hypothetical protein HJC23_008016 [Cyclotella cryptica]|uniref:Alpha-1,3/1,6-mannosyltransferase ALG2 n=1 Tax=Cyclotella cryptica TaxID=29204 RepID=A0ABD3Q2X8_9STRA|eukprot:CCRYP_009125-RA/>CCRYP_009125-RA protein AED:0.00 eAED:0.00 QI:92/-1/1/1/-1/1/1/87/573